ncbi:MULTISPECIES: DUF4149 domain-containing protein [Cupriavidus]|uniref:DUF4149 domain-containing protein n=1 Tax=unclassified Cupriavidus TaxID=2640874 RepID=UPI000B28C6DA|nr:MULTISPECIES: DUF4149 domain-containing protein [unclassified Cupriavidus]
MFSSSYSNLPPLPHRIFLLLTVVWAGSLWTVGYMVAPTLFSVLPNREMAGMIAGHLFRTEAILGITVGVLQLVLCNVMIRRGAKRYRTLRWIVLAMLVCVLAGYFGVQPFMEGLKVRAQALNLGVSESPFKGQFGMLHGVSSVIYLVHSILALVLVWRAAAPRSAGE